MAFLIFAAKQQEYIAIKSRVNAQLMAINQKLLDLQSFAACLGNGYVSMNDLTQAPPSVFGRMQAFAQQSTMGALQSSQQNIGPAMAMNQANFEAMLKQQYGNNTAAITQARTANENMLKSQLFSQARKGYVDQERSKLNVEERKMEQQQKILENQLKFIAAQEENIEKGIDEGAKKAAPKYVA